MLISLTLVIRNERLDIQVNREQKLQETLEILADSGRLPCLSAEDSQTVHSMRRKERINTKLTYEQANIYTGDILYIKQQDN
ncbi:hypothetical protein EDD76_10173 [Kineothrix alysoides]|jgi:hypothetical protein|uniref:Uncharacterized protein n=1 Tax=Kineothrix alysoides TaxID=1469948 RepID=A0A4R1R604_9FIRM|nr:hypothetical protein [Kineothrix alysoides]TCL60976.1 hypothetical protein EDD76_10173 [Kineothrix alysoides]